MKPELKRIHSPDGYDIEHFSPAKGDHFAILLQLMIGPESQDGEESFDVVVCSPGWLKERARERGVVDLRHHLLVDVYEWGTIVDYVEGFLSAIEEECWQAVAARVARLGHWEFEDYKP